MTHAPWALDPTTEPALRRLRDDVCQLLAAGRVWTIDAIADALQITWGPQAPPPEWVAAGLAADQRLWRLPDGRWVHLGAATGDRWFMTEAAPTWQAMGLLAVGIDLATALVSYASWPRIPVTTRRGRGLLERVPAHDAEAQPPLAAVVCPVSLVPSDDEIVAVVPGPEGLWIGSAPGPIDEMADLRYRRALNRHLREHPAVAAHPDHTRQVPRPWSLTDVELVVLASDATSRRTAVTSLSAAAATVPAAAGRAWMPAPPDGGPAWRADG